MMVIIFQIIKLECLKVKWLLKKQRLEYNIRKKGEKVVIFKNFENMSILKIQI